MYYIYRSESSNNIWHVTKDSTLYPESRLLDIDESKEAVIEWSKKMKKEICWCDENPIPNSDPPLRSKSVQTSFKS